MSGAHPTFLRGVLYKILDAILIGLPTLTIYFLRDWIFLPDDGLLNIVRVFLLLLLFFIGQWIIGYYAYITFLQADNAMGRNMRLFLADYMRRLPLGFHMRRDAGKIDALFTTNFLYLDARIWLDTVISAIVVPLVVFIALALNDWRMALVAVITVPFALAILGWAGRIFAQVWRQQSAARTAANSRMVEYIQVTKTPILGLGDEACSYPSFGDETECVSKDLGTDATDEAFE